MTDKSEDPVVGSDTGRSAALVLRVWVVDDEPPPRLRARVLEVTENSGELVVVATAGSVEELCAAIRHWLDDFLAA